MSKVISVNGKPTSISLTRKMIEFKHAYEKARKEDNFQTIRSFYKDQVRGFCIS